MKQKKHYDEITILHAMGAVMILLCHFSQKAGLSMLGEVFISGVSLFLLVSGFLAGESNGHGIEWLKRKAARILVPYFVWVIPCLCILYYIDKNAVSLFQASFLMLNLQGLNYLFWGFSRYVGVTGLAHLWFTTEIMFCYVLVVVLDLLNKLLKRGKWGGNNLCGLFIFLIVVIQPILFFCGIQISYIITFFIGYAISQKKLEQQVRWCF